MQRHTLANNLSDLLVFIRVVEAGSFVAGAKSSDLTRSAAGKAVSRLEDRLGSRLLNRTTRKLSLTPEGETLYAHGRSIAAAVQDAERSLSNSSSDVRGTLRLAVPDGFGRRIVLPLLGTFMDRWPNVQVEVAFSDRLNDIVADGFDLALRIGVTSPSPGLITRTLKSYPVKLCASTKYLMMMGEPARLEDLARHNGLLYASAGQHQVWKAETAVGDWTKVTIPSRLRLESGEALRQAAIADLGIALLPSFMIDDDLAAGRLAEVLKDVNFGKAPVLALYPSKRLLEPRVRAFIDFLSGALT